VGPSIPPRAHTRVRPSHKLPCDHPTDTCTTYRALPASRQSSNVPAHKGGAPLPRARGLGFEPKYTQGGLKNQGLQATRHMRLTPTPTSADLEHRHSLRVGPKRAIRRRPQTIDTEGAPTSRSLRNTMHDTPKAQAWPWAVYIRNDKSMLEPQKASSGLGSKPRNQLVHRLWPCVLHHIKH
jgi:hypothetical protein